MYAILGCVMLVSVSLVAAWVIAVVAVRWRVYLKNRELRYCPGPSLRWFSWLLPTKWWRTRCGYDLHGLHEDAPCPECGRATPSDRRRRVASTVAPAPVPIALLGVVLLAMTLRDALHRGWYVRVTPTTLLIQLERPGEPLDHRLARELERRVERAGVRGRQAEWLSGRLELSLDQGSLAFANRRWSAADYWLSRVRRMMVALGPAAEPALWRLTESANPQAQEFATDVLLDRGAPGDDPRILAWMVRSLWERGYGDGYGTSLQDDIAMRHLERHFDAAEAMIAELFENPDWKARLRAACLLVRNGGDEYLERAVPVLIEHLGDDRRYYNGNLAFSVLHREANRCRAWIELHVGDADRQRAAWCRVLIAAAEGATWEQTRSLTDETRRLAWGMRYQDSANEGFDHAW